MGRILDIENELIKKYNVTIDTYSKCKSRMHVHIKTRRICKWKPKSSLVALFDLAHEIGHIMTNHAGMTRMAEEYAATCWAIDVFKEYGLTVPDRVMHDYQLYIINEYVRGRRHHGKNYGEMNIYKYAGIDKSIPEFVNGLSKAWIKYISPWI